MDRELERLVQGVIFEDEVLRSELQQYLVSGPGRACEVLAPLLAHPHPRVRAEAARAALGRSEPSLALALEALVRDPHVLVRRALSELCADHAESIELRWILALAEDLDEHVRHHAVRAAPDRPPVRGVWRSRLLEDKSALVRAAAAERLAEAHGSGILPLVWSAWLSARAPEEALRLATLIERFVDAGGTWPESSPPPDPADRNAARLAFRRMLGEGRREVPRVDRFPDLHALLFNAARNASAGAAPAGGAAAGGWPLAWCHDLTAEALAGELPRVEGADVEVETLRRLVTGRGPRSAVLLGETGVGKTAIVHELAHRLGAEWRVVRVAPSDFLAETKYLGEWQTKVQKLLEAAAHPARVVVYVPSLHELSDAGRSEQNDTSIATMLAPHVESGRIALVGEATPEDWRRGLGRHANLRRLFAAIDVRPADVRTTRVVLDAICRRERADVAPEVLERLHELADAYFTASAQPGRSATLLRRVLSDRRNVETAAAPADAERITFGARDVLVTLARSTGIPVDFLDDAVPLDLEALRAFFEARVMGQREAVDAVLDLVTLVKSGLCDPGKPLGVLLFVGPTGVGKTELSRALAELLFGDPARLQRFDMSEFASPDSFERLIGNAHRPGILTSAVREHPFSVVLLDEIEKANLNVFDLCLQIFDAGRLTDGAGRTADFRRSIVILTSNVGSAVPTEQSLGFVRATPAPPSAEHVDRELRQFFRPEFLNRIDRIVCFRPLALETAEMIVRRELQRVLERSGIGRRGLVVDVDPAALGLLLESGYSPAFGARPLKRTIERLVLLPLARAIATGALPAQAMVSLLVQGGAIVARIHRGEEEGAGTPGGAGEAASARRAGARTDGAPGKAALVAAAPGAGTTAGSVAGLEDLRARAARARTGHGDVAAEAARWDELHARLMEASSAPGLWSDREVALAVLDDLHRADALKARLDRHQRDLAAFEEQAQRTRERRALPRLEERLGELESEGAILRRLLALPGAAGLCDAIVLVRRVKARGERLDAVGLLARAYEAWCARHEHECSVLDDRLGGDPEEDAVALAIHGAGAHALLAREAGLHTFEAVATERRARHGRKEVVRVSVLPARAVDPALAADTTVDDVPWSGQSPRFLSGARRELVLHHRPTRTTIRAVRRADDDGIDTALAWLGATIAERAREIPAHIVRQIRISPDPRVRDKLAPHVALKLHRLLEGDLDALLGA